MLRRISFMNQRKVKKTENEKTQSIVKAVIEKKLVESNNGKPVSELLPNFTLQLAESEATIKNFNKDVESFVLIANKYLQYKSHEEKAKVSFLHDFDSCTDKTSEKGLISL